MALNFKEGCPLVKELTDKLDNVISNYSQSNRAEIKEICENIKKFRKAFSNTYDLYEIEQSFDNILASLLKEEYEEFHKIVTHYRNDAHLLDLRENGGTVYVTTSEDEFYGKAPSKEIKPTTVGDIKKMLEQYPDDMVALQNCEGGVYGSPTFSSYSIDDDTLELECIDIPKNYKYKNNKGEKEFIFFD